MYSIMLDKVSKSYQTNNYVVKAVNQADFAADKGTSVAIIGPSGSGKSTLLNMMGLILHPDSGRIIIEGEDVTNLQDSALCRFRNAHFGYIVQDFALIERESVFNNIRIPLQGDVPSPAKPPEGCTFHPRCPRCTERCRKERPELREYTVNGISHFVACHLAVAPAADG